MAENIQMTDAGAEAKDGEREENGEESDREDDAAQPPGGNPAPQVDVAEFDYSVENFFAAMDAIDALCGTSCEEGSDASELERFSSMVTFLKEWKFFYYEPKVINFAYDQVKEVTENISLPQFSAAPVPKMTELPGERKQSDSNDFILHAGGLVWALDWCPGSHGKRDSKIKCEYLAVAAHPPSSAYHKIGAPMIGRGAIQIWCLVSLNEEVEIPLARTQGKGRPRKEHVKQKPDLDGIEVSATRRPRGRPRKNPAKEKPTTPRTRGRPRKRPASSSDEENLSLTRPRGRPTKKLTLSALDLNGPKDLSPQNLTGSPKKSSATISIGDNIPSVRKSRGRPRKHQLPGIVDANKKEELPSLNNNGIISMVDFVVPLCVDSGKNSMDVPISSAIRCEELLQPRRGGRSRDKQKPILSSNCSVSSSLVLLNDATVLPNPSEPGTSDGKELLLCSSNEVLKTGDNVLSLSESQNNSLALPILAAVDCKEGQIQPKHRGRPRKKEKQILSSNCSVSSSLVLVNDATVWPNPSEPWTSDGKELPLCSNNEVLKTGDNVLSLSESQNNSLALPILAAADFKEGPIQPKRRGRPTKRPVLSSNHFVSSSLIGLENDATVSPNRNRLGTSDGKAELPPSSNSEILNTGDRVLSFSMDVSVPKSSALLRKDTEEMCEKIDKCQTGSESVPSDVRERREAKGKNKGRRDCKNPILSEFCKDHKLLAEYMLAHGNHYEDSLLVSCDAVDKRIPKAESDSPSIPQGLALPRVVFCLAHNGKVAWDVKWRPATVNAACNYRMGYLAVLLGNGSLEVWEVPLPGIVKTLFTSSHDEVTDPRFLKLTPVFRCSKVKHGDMQSIPLTLEWSPSLPCDLILAGCHDGTVVLWKFSMQCSSQVTDTRPLLCFTADSAPIRALAWAPEAREEESNNLFATAGHKGLKFWDVRDPYRPLWEINPIQRAVLSIDWVKDPRCVVMSLDDGTMRILSLCNAAYHVPSTGKTFVGSKYQGLHSYSCSSFAIWSIHVSQTTGFAAYCCADGSTVRFQLTTKSVDKEPRRGRMPHFLCGSLLEEAGALTIYTPLPNAPVAQVPFAQKKSSTGCKNANRSIQLNFSDAEQTKGVGSLVPAPYSGGDLAIVSRSGNSQVPPKMKKTQKFSNSKKKHDPGKMVDQALTVKEEGQGILEKSKTQDEGSKEEFEVFPSKILAMHRVRWNMNKGSERWLCYGGAAGIIRCQQMF